MLHYIPDFVARRCLVPPHRVAEAEDALLAQRRAPRRRRGVAVDVRERGQDAVVLLPLVQPPADVDPVLLDPPPP
eukprot:gene8837-biopygen10165